MIPYSDEQLRVLVNLGQYYDAWIASVRARRELPYGMQWKSVSGTEYLYEMQDRRGNGRSAGKRAAATEARFRAFQEQRKALDESAAQALERMEQSAKVARALRLPGIAREAGQILAELDIRGLLGDTFMVAGTNALLAYNLEAGGTILMGADMATDDFDLLWTRDHATALMAKAPPPSILAALKAVDETYTVNEERPFQLRNRKAYEVEILVPPSRLDALPKADRIRPAVMEEVEWLLPGTPVTQVVPAKGDSAAKIVAPDPRLYALQKLWLAGKPARNPLKKPKDRRQGDALLDACAAGELPRHPLERSFISALPPALLPHFERWAKERGFSQT
jgi:hypothetical protein